MYRKTGERLSGDEGLDATLTDFLLEEKKLLELGKIETDKDLATHDRTLGHPYDSNERLSDCQPITLSDQPIFFYADILRLDLEHAVAKPIVANTFNPGREADYPWIMLRQDCSGQIQTTLSPSV